MRCPARPGQHLACPCCLHAAVWKRGTALPPAHPEPTHPPPATHHGCDLAHGALEHQPRHRLLRLLGRGAGGLGGLRQEGGRRLGTVSSEEQTRVMSPESSNQFMHMILCDNTTVCAVLQHDFEMDFSVCCLSGPRGAFRCVFRGAAHRPPRRLTQQPCWQPTTYTLTRQPACPPACLRLLTRSRTGSVPPPPGMSPSRKARRGTGRGRTPAGRNAAAG